MGSLANNVHPLLARDKFAKSVNHAKVFLQPAKLVTRMLATPQAQHYFLALITKSKHVSSLHGTAKDLRHRFWSDKDIGKLEDLDRQCIDTWLRKVAEAITYSVRTCDNGALAEIKKIPYDSSKTDLGHCVICISRKEHHDPLRGDNLSPTERIIRQFNLAIALLHELAHAVSYAITARQDEDFLEDAIVAEAGFEFEARLFGACPSYSANAPKLVRWFPWPSRILLGGEAVQGSSNIIKGNGIRFEEFMELFGWNDLSEEKRELISYCLDQIALPDMATRTIRLRGSLTAEEMIAAIPDEGITKSELELKIKELRNPTPEEFWKAMKILSEVAVWDVFTEKIFKRDTAE